MSKIDKIISANLKSLRVKSGLSQEEMAEILGCTPTRLYLMERGLHVISATTIFHLCFILNCNVDQVFPPVRIKGAGRKKEIRMALKEIIKRLAA
jgi:transcriptional regulator with XRE-family HTH domain